VENDKSDIYTLQSSPSDENDWSIVTKKNKMVKNCDKENERNGVIAVGTMAINGRAEYVDDKGHSYIVNYENDKIHGKGKIVTDFGTIEINWNMGIADLKGVIYYNDGSYYCGEIRDLFKHGTGQVIYPNNETYDGSFVDDKRHGDGIYCCEEYIYQGKFADDVMNGHGVKNYNNGDMYTGEFSKGLKHGYGTYYNATTHEYYEGNYKNDEISGFGTLVSEGRGSRGHFMNGALIGTGVKINPNREFQKVIGEFDANELFQGHAITTWNNGDKFEGTAVDGKIQTGTITKKNGVAILAGTFGNSSKLNYGLTGNGTIIYHYTAAETESFISNDTKKPIKEECNYNDGVKEGLGRTYYNNGSIYVGNYVNGKQHGQGMYTWSLDNSPVWYNTYDEAKWELLEENERNGHVTKRAWYEGDWAGDDRNGMGYMEIYYDVKDNIDKSKTRWYAGDTYQGLWLKGNRHGQGTLINTVTGEKFVGEFKNHYKSNGTLYNVDGSIKLEGEWLDDVFLDPKTNVNHMIYEIISESYMEYLLGVDT